MAKQYKNFLKNLKNMNLDDLDITAQDLEESDEQPITEELDNDDRTGTRGRKTRKSFREYSTSDDD